VIQPDLVVLNCPPAAWVLAPDGAELVGRCVFLHDQVSYRHIHRLSPDRHTDTAVFDPVLAGVGVAVTGTEINLSVRIVEEVLAGHQRVGSDAVVNIRLIVVKKIFR
jgi:hypothetical protein